MLPRTNISGISIYDKNFIETPTTNLTINNIESDFLNMISAPILTHAYPEIVSNTKYSAEDPNVKVFCGYADDTVTVETVKM